MHTDADIELRILSHPRNLCVVRAAIETAVRRLGFNETDAAQIILAVDEAMANCIRHGYQGATDKPIWLQFHATPHETEPSFRITIEDHGRQIDPDQIHGRELDDVRPGGLGVHIIRQVMDEVSYSRREGCGMRLVMSKKLRPSATAAAPPGSGPNASKEVSEHE